MRKINILFTMLLAATSACNFVGIGDKGNNNILKKFSNDVKTGDIIFRAERDEQSQKLNFNFHGIIEKSGNSVFVWDNQNTIKRPLSKWVNSQTNGKVKVYRVRSPHFNLKEVKVKGLNYDSLMNSKDLKFIIEN